MRASLWRIAYENWYVITPKHDAPKEASDVEFHSSSHETTFGNNLN